MIKNSFKLPEKAFVNKFIPKNKFYQRAALISKIQKDFVDKIQRITWKYKLAEDTIGISKTDKVSEIQIFEIQLKEKEIPKNLLKIIDKAIPYQILYCFVYKDSFAYAITLKGKNKPESYYFSDWDEKKQFNFTGIDLEKVYQKLIRAFIRKEAAIKKSFGETIAVDNKIKTLEKDIIVLKNKVKREKQFNRKVDINKTLQDKKSELKKIKKEGKDG